MHVNQISISGRLVADPQFTVGATPERDRVWCRIAVTRNGGNKVEYVPFVAWGGKARAIRDFCTKGKQMLVTGELRSHITTKPDGTHDNYFEVNARDVSFGQDPVAKRVGFDFGLREKDDGKVTYVDPSKPTMKEAYEANKKADVCVVCGKVLSLHPSVGVKYCKCVEELA